MRLSSGSACQDDHHGLRGKCRITFVGWETILMLHPIFYMPFEYRQCTIPIEVQMMIDRLCRKITDRQ